MQCNNATIANVLERSECRFLHEVENLLYKGKVPCSRSEALVQLNWASHVVNPASLLIVALVLVLAGQVGFHFHCLVRGCNNLA